MGKIRSVEGNVDGLIEAARWTIRHRRSDENSVPNITKRLGRFWGAFSGAH